jgi:hypothetical protein
MSHQLTALLPSAVRLLAADINSELERLGLPCSLQADPVLTDGSGEVVARLTAKGMDCRIQYSDASYWLDEIPELRVQAGGRDRAIDFELGADMAETFAVSAICAALASVYGAIVYYQPDDLYYTPEDAAEEARTALVALG